MITLRGLVYGCFRDHLYLRDRDDHGELILRCERCNAVHRLDLSIAGMARGPAHQPRDPLGRHDYRVRTEATKSKVYWGRWG